MSHLVPNCMERPRQSRRGFTLIEILIVLAIFSVLTAVALPVIRTLVSDQKGANASRSITAYIDSTRRRAMAEGRPMGVLIERLDNRSGSPLAARQAASIRLRQMNGIPAYTGESSNARAVLNEDTSWTNNGVAVPGINRAEFDANDSQLLALSAKVSQEGGAPPVKAGDLLELPGGIVVAIAEDLTFKSSTIVVAHFDLRQPIGGSGTTYEFPSAERTFVADRPVKYKIYRQAVRSSSQPYDLPRGLAIDLNYSGVGATGNQFAPQAGSINGNIVIMFGSDGRVMRVNGRDGNAVPPSGLIFLCVGEGDGIRSDSLLTSEKAAPANLLNLKSIWVVINPNTGRAVSSPFQTVSSAFPDPVSAPVTSPYALDANNQPVLAGPIRDTREFAFLSDTVDNK